ncbi:MAG: hypothetical protein QXV29_01330 [Candidatus Woesearchaeota archaeon]
MFLKLSGMLILILLNFLGTLILEKELSSNTSEPIIIVLGIILAVILLYGFVSNARWRWQLFTIFFAGSLANVTWLYFKAGEGFLPFIGTVFFAWLGLMISIISIPSAGTENVVEPVYEEASQPETAYTPPVIGKKRKRKR